MRITNSSDFIFNLTYNFYYHTDNHELCHNSNQPECEDDDISTDYVGPVALLFMCQFFIGIMTTIYGSVGFIYLDDNSEKKESAVFIGGQIKNWVEFYIVLMLQK